MRDTGKLAANEVQRLKKAGRYGDGHNLYLQITPAGVKSWLLRFEQHGRERWMGIGPTHTISLAEARQRARAARQLLLDGIDPIDHRSKVAEASAVAAAKNKTFAEVSKEYLDAHEGDWTNAKHAAQWETSLTKDCKAIAHLPIGAIDTSHILAVLQPIWRTKPETASRTRARVERVIAYAVAAQYRRREDGNPARWDGHLQELLGKKSAAKRAKRAGKDAHLPAMSYAELPAFLATLRQRTGITARGLEFTILTAARSGETLGAKWDEIDFEGKVWTVPAARMKAKKEHRVPLSARAFEIVRSLPREDGNPYLFIGGRKGAPMRRLGMLELLTAIRPGLTVHGFRSTFRDWAAERTNYPREVAEMALAHAIPDAVERAYRRSDLFEKRQQLMEAWAKYCSTKPAQLADEDNVRPLRKAR
jgi:integrase